MLLAISVNSIESLQAFIFYLMQYSISNITGFILIISIGYTLYMYRLSKQEEKQGEEEKILIDQDNSPIQYTSQLKGYYFINPNIAISLAVIIYSFVGIPPLVGFFGKQMVLSSALDKGYVFISLVAILTSVISAVYYLNIVKEIFFEKSDYMLNNSGEENKDNNESSNNVKQINIIGNYDYSSVLSTNLAATIAMFTLVITLFMLNPQQ
jgi:NADH-ubiquinone oxidoreductase chain 2